MLIQLRQLDGTVESSTGILVDLLVRELLLPIPEQEPTIAVDAGPGVLKIPLLPPVEGRQTGKSGPIESRCRVSEGNCR